MSTVAAIFPIGNKFRAKFLFGSNLLPLDLFRQTQTEDELKEWLTSEFTDLELVSPEEFQMEVDHIKLYHSCIKLEKQTNAVLSSPLVDDIIEPDE